MLDYLTEHPSEIKGKTVKAEELWNYHFTVNVVDKCSVLYKEAFPLEHESPRVLARAKDSVLRVENEVNERTEVKRRRTSPAQPIRIQTEINRRKSSKRAQENIRAFDLTSGTQCSKMNVITIKLSNNSLLLAKYEADLLFQKGIRFVKNKEGQRSHACPAHGEKGLVPLA